MKKIAALSLLAALLLLAACQKEPWQDMRLFCESYNALAEEEILTPEQFTLEWAQDEGQRWQVCTAGPACSLITLEALPNGRLHTASLTMHAQEERGVFLEEAKCLLGAFTGAPPDQCARWLYGLGAEAEEVLGFVQLESEGFRLAYTANAAGRYLRVSSLTYLPEEEEPPTLRETVNADAFVPSFTAENTESATR